MVGRNGRTVSDGEEWDEGVWWEEWEKGMRWEWDEGVGERSEMRVCRVGRSGMSFGLQLQMLICCW